MKSARIQLIETATERVCRIIAENYGIKVVFKGNLCCTDGKRIFLPVLGHDVDEGLLEALPGLVDHESSHVLHSDFQILKTIEKDPDARKLHTISNLLEDSRIEPAMVRKWRGCRSNFEKTANWACKKVIEDWDKISPWGKFTQICAGVAMYGENYWFTKEVMQREPELSKYVNAVSDMLKRAKDLPDTKAVVALAREVLEKIRDLVPPPPPEEEEGGKGKQKSRGEGKGSGHGSGKASQEPDDSLPGSASSNNDNDADEEEEVPDCLRDDYQISDEEQEKIDSYSREKMFEKDAAKQQKKSSGEYLIYSTERDVIEVVSGGSHQEARKLLDESRSITNVMRSRMMRNLLAQNRERRIPNQERGKIDRRSLFRASLGTSKKVFYKREDAPQFNTRAILLIDHSGSMHGSQLRLAAASALLFGEVLDSLKIPFEIWGNSTSTKSYEGRTIYDLASPEDKKLFSRFGGLWIGIYKKFEESWNSVKHRCSAMSTAHDNTYDGEVLRLAAQKLLQYPETRRIIFTFNDGEPCPNCHEHMDIHDEYLRRVAREVEKLVEVFAIGIETEAVKQYYSNAVTINKLTDLPNVMIGELDRMLRQHQQQYIGAIP